MVLAHYDNGQDLDLSTLPHTALSTPFEAFTIDMQCAADEYFAVQSQRGPSGMDKRGNDMDWQRSLFVNWTGSVNITTAGTVDAVVYWFDLQLTPGSGNTENRVDPTADSDAEPLKLFTGTS